MDNRLIRSFSLTVMISVLQIITQPNVSNANPYDNLDLYRDYRNVENIGLSCKQLLEKFNQAINDSDYYLELSRQSVNYDNQQLYLNKAQESQSSAKGYLNKYKNKGCN